MALGIGNNSSVAHHYMRQREKLATEKEMRTTQAQRQDALSDSESQWLEDESPAALLQKFSQATDEMSAAMAQFRHRRDYEKKSSSTGETSFERVLDEDIESKFDKLVKILRGPESANIDSLLRHARSLFPDESDLVLVLRETLRRRDLDEVVRQRLKTLLAKAENEANPKRLKAGINVALKARLFGKTLMMSPALMRESYRGFLENDESEVEIYQGWVATYGVEKRHVVINFMEDALLADIDSVDPSCNHMEFGYLLGRISQIKLIRSSDALFIQGVLSNKVVRETHYQESAWLLLFFGMLQQPNALSDLLSQLLGDYFIIAKKKERSLLLQIIYRYSKKLPQEIFFSAEDREALLASFEILADKAFLHENIEWRAEKK